MNPFRPRSGPLQWRLIACLLAAALPAFGQISTLKKALEGPESVQVAPSETPEEARKRLEQWQAQASDALLRLANDGTEAALPDGITPAELEARRLDLERITLTVSRSLKNLSTAADARKALAASRSEESAWEGFEESPPYSLLMIDDLLNERDAVAAKLTSYQSSHANYQLLLATTIEETKAAEETVNAAVIATQSLSDGQNGSPKWRLEAARAKARLLASRAGLLQYSCDGYEARIAAAKSDLALIDRKLKTASANSRFGDEDLAKLTKISAERTRSLKKEIQAVSKRLATTNANRLRAQASLDDLVSSATPETEPTGLNLAKFRAEVAESQTEALQSLIEDLEALIQLERIHLRAYQHRRDLIEAREPGERDKALESLSSASQQLQTWTNVLTNETSGFSADLGKLESRAASIDSDDPRFALLNEQRAAANEKLAMHRRLSQALVFQRRLMERWIADYAPDPEEPGVLKQISTFGSAAWGTIRKFWAFEVMSSEERVEIDGQTLIGKKTVTLGLLLRALFFFVIGYWVIAKIVNRIQGGLVRRNHIAEAQARTLRNWVMIVIGVFLVLGTLAFLKIPLTVFAFFGGALAIGLGFGLQTLIKNFISGIIVLVERKIRVGDILDVDGIIGTVVEVNTRSSVIRSADDVETMIPNSVFLENRVTNWTLSSSRMRRSLRVGVAYGSNPQKVIEILNEAASRHGLVLKDPAAFTILEDFGDNALVFTLYFWVHLGGGTNPLIVTSDLRLMIEKRFGEAEINVPFPQRDLHLTADKPIHIQMSRAPQD